jgi:APA family basic amino acid/polyamine antiporter
MGTVQVVTTIVKFVVLAFMATVGLFFIQAANYVPFKVSGERAIAAIGGGMAIALFSDLSPTPPTRSSAAPGQAM